LKRSTSGVTLIELLVTIAIIAIVAVFGIPSYRSVTTANRMATEINSLTGDLQYARAEAIKEGQPVTVCVSSTGTSCAASNSWQSGWIVFSDANGNKSVDTGGTTPDTVLRYQQAFGGSDTLVGTTTGSAGGLVAVTFNRVGFSTDQGTLTLHDSNNTLAWRRCLKISLVGHIQADQEGKCP